MKELMMQQLAKVAFGQVCAMYATIKQYMPDASFKERAVLGAAMFGAMRAVADAWYEACVSSEPHLVAIYETSRTYATDSWNKHKAEYGVTNDESHD